MKKVKEYYLYDKHKNPVVLVKWINVHAYSLKGVKGGPLENIHMRINPDELPTFKKRFDLKIEADFKPRKYLPVKFTIMELLMCANYNLNIYNSEHLTVDKSRDVKGKAQLQKAIDLLAKGYNLKDDVRKEVENKFKINNV